MDYLKWRRKAATTREDTYARLGSLLSEAQEMVRREMVRDPQNRRLAMVIDTLNEAKSLQLEAATKPVPQLRPAGWFAWT